MYYEIIYSVNNSCLYLYSLISQNLKRTIFNYCKIKMYNMIPKCIRADIKIVSVKSGTSNLSYFIFSAIIIYLQILYYKILLSCIDICEVI